MISLILVTYNQPGQLKACLTSVINQDLKDFEVLIADDGSGEETRQVVETFRQHLGERLVHVWHEDEGFRRAAILNAAIHKARGEKLVFIDSDTCLHPRFMSDHAEALENCDVFLGRRVMLGPKPSRLIEQEPSRFGGLFFWLQALVSGFSKENPTRHLNRGLRLPAWLRKIFKYDRVPDMIGSNCSMRRHALEKVNGFDETHIGYGNEDGDLYIRLRNSGARVAGAKCYAVQWHLWHKTRAFKPGAEDFYNDRLKNDHTSVWCENGLVKPPARHTSATGAALKKEESK